MEKTEKLAISSRFWFLHYVEAAEILDLDKEFMARVDELTMECEIVTRAGLLREAMSGLAIKREEINSDRTTHLDYVKEIADLQGIKKTQIEHSGGVKVNVTVAEAIR